MREYASRKVMGREESLKALIEITCKNLADTIHEMELNLKPNWRSDKSACKTIMDTFIGKISNGKEKKRLMAISLGDKLESAQENNFAAAATTLLSLLE